AFSKQGEQLVRFHVGNGTRCVSLEGTTMGFGSCLLGGANPSGMPLSNWNWLLLGQSGPIPRDLLLPRENAHASLDWQYQVLVFKSADEARQGASITPRLIAGRFERALRDRNVLVVYRLGTPKLAHIRSGLRALG